MLHEKTVETGTVLIICLNTDVTLAIYIISNYMNSYQK